MSDVERQRAQKEALGAAPRALSSTERARLWAGMNRYLAAETHRDHEAAEKQRREAEPLAEQPE